MKNQKRYALIEAWNDYESIEGEPYHLCTIRPATEELIENDGFNIMGHNGAEGHSIDVFNSVSMAIQTARKVNHYFGNIEFFGLDKKVKSACFFVFSNKLRVRF